MLKLHRRLTGDKRSAEEESSSDEDSEEKKMKVEVGPEKEEEKGQSPTEGTENDKVNGDYCCPCNINKEPRRQFFSIMCDFCKKWMHNVCVDLPNEEIKGPYVCPKCKLQPPRWPKKYTEELFTEFMNKAEYSYKPLNMNELIEQFLRKKEIIFEAKGKIRRNFLTKLKSFLSNPSSEIQKKIRYAFLLQIGISDALSEKMKKEGILEFQDTPKGKTISSYTDFGDDHPFLTIRETLNTREDSGSPELGVMSDYDDDVPGPSLRPVRAYMQNDEGSTPANNGPSTSGIAPVSLPNSSLPTSSMPNSASNLKKDEVPIMQKDTAPASSQEENKKMKEATKRRLAELNDSTPAKTPKTSTNSALDEQQIAPIAADDEVLTAPIPQPKQDSPKKRRSTESKKKEETEIGSTVPNLPRDDVTSTGTDSVSVDLLSKQPSKKSTDSLDMKTPPSSVEPSNNSTAETKPATEDLLPRTSFRGSSPPSLSPQPGPVLGDFVPRASTSSELFKDGSALFNLMQSENGATSSTSMSGDARSNGNPVLTQEMTPEKANGAQEDMIQNAGKNEDEATSTSNQNADGTQAQEIAPPAPEPIKIEINPLIAIKREIEEEPREPRHADSREISYHEFFVNFTKCFGELARRRGLWVQSGWLRDIEKKIRNNREQLKKDVISWTDIYTNLNIAFLTSSKHWKKNKDNECVDENEVINLKEFLETLKRVVYRFILDTNKVEEHEELIKKIESKMSAIEGNMVIQLSDLHNFDIIYYHLNEFK